MLTSRPVRTPEAALSLAAEMYALAYEVHIASLLALTSVSEITPRLANVPLWRSWWDSSTSQRAA